VAIFRDVLDKGLIEILQKFLNQYEDIKYDVLKITHGFNKMYDKD
jgi:hypothetical protein